METEHPGGAHWVEFLNSRYTLEVRFGPGSSGGINLNCEDSSDWGNNPDWWMRITVYDGQSDAIGSRPAGRVLDRQNVTDLLCPSSVVIQVDATGRFTVVPDDDDYDGHPLPTGRRE